MEKSLTELAEVGAPAAAHMVWRLGFGKRAITFC